MTTSRRLLRAMASLFGLGALVGGVPALLIGVVGWPLPHGLPSLDEVSTALNDGWRPDERFVMGLLALLVWLLWAQVLRHVVGQVRLQLRLRQAAATTGDQLLPQVAFASAPRRGPVQRLAGWLVGGLMMASPILPTTAMAAPAPRIPVVLTVTQAMADPVPAPASLATAPATAPDPDAPTYVVHTWAERRDCLWNIAERYLADPFRWTEIRDLNRDRVQPDGRRLGDDPSSWVYPGWELALPADATGAEVVPARSASAPPSPAPAPAPTPGPAPGPAATTAPSPATSPMTAAPTTAASATLAPTTTAAAPTSSTVAASAPSAPGGSVPHGPAPTSAPRPAASTSEGKGAVVAVNPWAQRAALAGALGLPIFALGGWLKRLRRGRTEQASRCRPGRDVVRPADPEVETVERRARAIAADQAEEWIDATLRALTAALTESSMAAAPQVRCVRAGELGIEVLLGEPFPVAPEGWEAADGGHVWHPAAELSLDQLRAAGAEHAALTPALVSLGATPEGPILADLEGFGALAVEGDVDRVRAFLAGVSLELASATWAEGVELRVCGLAGFERLEAATAEDSDLLGEVRSTSNLAAEALASHGSALGARVADVGEPWYPMVVVAGPDADPGLIEDLVGAAAAGSGVAVVAAGPVATDWQLVVGPDGAAVLKPLGLDVRMGGVVELPTTEVPAEAAGPELVEDLPDGLAPSDEIIEPLHLAPPIAADVEAPELLVDQAGLDEAVIGSAVGALAAVAEVDDVAAPTPFAAPSKSRRAKPQRRRDCEVWVSVLRRNPEVTGWAKEARGRRKLAEVAMYLAIYGAERPIPAGELRTNCWPPRLEKDPTRPDEPPRLRDVTPEAFHQAMSRLRKQLGEGAAGWHLPPAVDGAYSPGPGFGCDWVLFQALVVAGAQTAARHETAKAIALYREALELVEGEPFADVPPGACAWADAKHLITDIQLAVAKAASDLAKLAMTSEPETAAWAAQQGLLLLPTQLELFDTWAIAAAEMGDAGALEQCIKAKCWAHEQLDPDGGVAPETMELYRRLKAKLADKDLTDHAQGV